jgi:hypothetical protein
MNAKRQPLSGAALVEVSFGLAIKAANEGDLALAQILAAGASAVSEVKNCPSGALLEALAIHAKRNNESLTTGGKPPATRHHL